MRHFARGGTDVNRCQGAFSLASLVAAVTLLVLPGAANAERFCVHKVLSCLLTGTSKATIDEALTAAELTNEDDEVLVGANGGIPYDESPSFVDATWSVDIVGDGVGQTIVHAEEGGGAPVVAFTVRSPGSSISGMTIRAPDVSDGMALWWDGKAFDIRAEHTGSTSTETLGMRAEGNAVLEDSTVDVNGFRLFELIGATGVKILGSTLIGDGSGINANGGNLTIERSTIVARRAAVEGGSGSSINIYNALLRMTGTTVPGDASISILSGGQAVIRHATVVGAGEGRGISVDANSSSSTANVFDSIVDNFGFALNCNGEPGHTATLNASYSNWTDPTELTDPDCSSNVGVGNDTSTEPVFVSTMFFPNFRLRAPSPLIDAAEPVDPLTEDRDGLPRPIDGDGVGGARSDMGAYEYQHQAPSASIVAPATAAIGETVGFSAAGSSDPDPGDVLSYSWDFGDGGKATGFAAQHAFSSGGEFTVVLTATDPTGLSDSASAQVVVPSPAPTGEGKPNNPPAPKEQKSKVAKITELNAVPKRIRRGKGLPMLVRGLRKPGFQFKINRNADLVLTLARCKGRRGCRKHARVRGSARFSAVAGKNTIKFRGRLTRRKLRKGRYRATLKVVGGASASVIFRLI